MDLVRRRWRGPCRMAVAVLCSEHAYIESNVFATVCIVSL
jgi:hypothetical protein